MAGDICPRKVFSGKPGGKRSRQRGERCGRRSDKVQDLVDRGADSDRWKNVKQAGVLK